jgi:ATP adenylyltransferase
MTRLEQLWAPWRLGYIKGETDAPARATAELNWLPGADRECFICRGVADQADREHQIVRRGDAVVTVLNRYPYNNGHLLVAPMAHKARLDQLTADEHLGLMQEITSMVSLIEKLMNAEGFNIGVNLGRVAGAGLPGHLHWHIVPRWNGDVNFMPALAGVKSIPQSLDALWEILTESLSQSSSSLKTEH